MYSCALGAQKELPFQLRVVYLRMPVVTEQAMIAGLNERIAAGFRAYYICIKASGYPRPNRWRYCLLRPGSTKRTNPESKSGRCVFPF